MTLKIAISPCPNDTFIFENIFNKKVEIAGISFNFHFLDIEELNQAASAQKFDIIKISCAHFKNVAAHYELLKSGGAMGYGVGPLVVRKANSEIEITHLADKLIAIPGEHTTANFLLSHLFPEITNKKILLFSDIENAVLQDEVDLGLLIHEGRFTYQEKGLALVGDLGTLWHDKTNLPIPLGCIVIKKEIPNYLHEQVERLITYSISNYTQEGQPIISNFIKDHAQEMDTDTMLQHIRLYVNDFSKNMGESGMRAIEMMG